MASGSQILQRRALLLYIPHCWGGVRIWEEMRKSYVELLQSFCAASTPAPATAPKEALAGETDWTGTRRAMAGAASWWEGEIGWASEKARTKVLGEAQEANASGG